MKFDDLMWFRSFGEEILHSQKVFVCIWDCTQACMGLITLTRVCTQIIVC